MNQLSSSLLFVLASTGLLLSACGGSNNACPDGFLAMDGVCLPAPDAGVMDAAMTDASADAELDTDAASDAELPDASSDADMADASSDADMADASSDADMADACVPTTFYADLDMDGFGDPSSSMDACTAPTGFVESATDCDDGAIGVNPSATEVCDGSVDENCDGAIDEGCACTDGDSRACGTDVGACTQGSQSCTAGMWGACSGGVTPSTETCNGVDDDCDGHVDQGNPDGGASCGSDVGACVAGTLTCTAGSLVCAGEVGPRAEFCDGLDNDCDGLTDEGVKQTFYADCDGDTFGDLTRSRDACNAADAAPFFGAGCGATRDTTDCNDDCASCHPGAAETCDLKDNDCDTLVDEGVTTNYYRDLDGDGFGAGSATAACSPPDASFVTDNTDCYDVPGALGPQVHPGQSAYFTSGYPGPKPFDYNCDGAESPRWTSVHSPDECLYRDTYAAEGWDSMPVSGCPAGGTGPACGTSGSYVTCRCVSLGCADRPGVCRVQECN